MPPPEVVQLQEAVERFTGSAPESESPPELTAIALRVIEERLAKCKCWQEPADDAGGSA